MSFRKITLALLLLAGCAREAERPDVPLEIQLGGSSACLADASDKLQMFTVGRLSDADVRAFWDCAGDALGDFTRLTQGDGAGGYTPRGLRRFIERYFLKSSHVSDLSLGHVMWFKRVLVGGREDLIAPGEIARARELLIELREASVTINPSARVLFGDARVDENETRLAAERLSLAAARLARWLARTNESIAIVRLERAARDFGFDDVSWLAPLKRILVGGSTEVITGGEWQPLLTRLGEWLGAASGLQAALREGFPRVLAREELPRALFVLAKVLDRPSSEEDWRDLTGRFDPRLTPAWAWARSRVLVSPASVRAWAAAWIEGLRGGSPPALAEVLVTGRPLLWDDEGRLIHDGTWHAWSASGRREMAWMSAALGRLREVYAPGSARMTEKQVQLAVDEILPLLQSFGWLAETKPTVAKRLLRQADLFNFASDGDGELSLSEATRELANILSSYRAADVWLRATGPQPDDVRAGPRLPALPRLIRAFDADGFRRYMMQAEDTVLGRTQTSPFSAGDLMLVATLFHYVEAFLERFDVDGDERIGWAEVGPAYLLFGPTLGRMFGPRGPTEALFTRTLKYGDPMAVESGALAPGAGALSRWWIRADRSNLMGLLRLVSKF